MPEVKESIWLLLYGSITILVCAICTELVKNLDMLSSLHWESM